MVIEFELTRHSLSCKKSVFCAVVLFLAIGLSELYAQKSSLFQADTALINKSFKSNADISGDNDGADTLSIDEINFPPAATSGSTFIAKPNIRVSKDTLDAPVDYSARDSIVYDIANKQMILYGDAVVEYKDVTVRGGLIIFNWGTNEVSAKWGLDSIGKKGGKPEFEQGENVFQADSLRFNFKTKRGKSSGAVTKANEGFLHTSEIKNVNDAVFFGRSARYTSCEYDHPHFYIEVAKAKIIKDKLIVGKPANLVIEDTRTPLFLPFGVFPLLKKRTTGLILPRFGESEQLGFFLNGMGYYWSINEQLDLTVTGDIYSLGSWGLKTDLNYNVRYKFAGSLNLGFNSLSQGERRTSSFVPSSKDFFVNWSLRMDPKRLFNSNLSASVYAGTRSFHQINVSDAQTFLQNTYRSTIAYQKWWPGKPYRFSVSANHNQNTQTRDFNVQLPQMNFAIARVNPFQRKVPTGGRKWYENIGFSYNFDAQNQINTKDSLLFTRETLQNMKSGMRHSVPVNASFNIAKFLVFSTGFDYIERWYFESTDREFVQTADTSFLQVNTNRGFNMVRDFGLNASLNTRVYGMFQFKKGKLKAIRHVVNPSLNFSYRPDFGLDRWGYYQEVQVDTTGRTQVFNRFQNGIYGSASRGAVGGMGFNIVNNIEIKVASKKDTIKGEKKIPILENLTFGGFYNFIADSFQLSPFRLAGNTRISQYFVLNFSGNFDAYEYDRQTNRRLNQIGILTGGKWLRMTNFNVNLNGSWSIGNQDGQPGDEFDPRRSLPQQDIDINGYFIQDAAFGAPLGYVNFSIPFSVNYNYSFNVNKQYRNGRDTAVITQTLGAGFNFSLTEKWKVGVNSGYDFSNKQISRTDISVYRDLHCWQLAFNWVPLGFQRSFSIELNVKSQLLRDLRLAQRKNWFDYN